ncbi:ankyrin repeat-containing domain protein [Aspergillus venezuelensis]
MFASNEKPPSPGFRLVICSRRIHGMRSSQTIKLDPDYDEQVYSDIQQFVRCRVQELGKVPGFNPELAAHVEETLLERSERTFLWVGLVMNELLQKSTCADLLFTLETLPKSLPGIYGRILLRVDEQKRQVVVSTLVWVTLAKCPLTMDELSGAINVQSPAILDRHRTIMDHIASCEPLLRVQGEEIGLIHQSIRDYLLRDHADRNPTPQGTRICPEKGHYAIAQACLNLVEKGGERIPEVPSQRSTILNYAIEAWSNHAKHAGAYSDRIFDMSRPMFRQGSKIAHRWIKCLFEADDEKISKLTRLHIASIFDLTPWARGLLAQKKRKISIILYLGMRDKDGHTALHLKGYDGYTPLTLAALGSNETVVRILLSYCWNINHQSKAGETPLMMSVIRKNANMARFLIVNGADINMKCHDGTTPLIMSVSGNSLELSELLIKLGADIDQQDNNGKTALLTSVEENNLEMCQVLTSYGANANKGSKTSSPLRLAAQRGYEDIAKLLIEHGAEINSTDEVGRAPLELAMIRGHASTMRVLLSHGADLGTLDRNYIGPVGRAVSYHPKVTIPILVEFGADADERNDFGTTPLILATHGGSIAAVEVLLRYNPDIHATHLGETARQMAARRKHHDVVRMLDEYERQLLKTNEDASPP